MWEEVRIVEEKTKKVDDERRRAGGRCEVGGRLMREEGMADDMRRKSGQLKKKGQMMREERGHMTSEGGL